MDSSLSVAVLAGGTSRRMGTDKGLVKIDGRPMALRALDAVLAGIEWPPNEVMFISNASGYEALAESVSAAPARVLADRRPGLGPLAGIETALVEATVENVFVVACDMPLVAPRTVRALARRVGAVAVIPASNSRLEPCFAIYSRRCLPVVSRLLDEGQLQAKAIGGAIEAAGIGDVCVLSIEGLASSNTLGNVNTLDDLAWARRAFAAGDTSDRENPGK